MILDLFACAGGTSTGMAMLGRTVVGIDHDPDACATHAAAGHPTIRADLTRPVPVAGEFEMVWASPPCTAFSLAGKGEGRELADVLVSRILAEDWSPMDADPAVWLVLPTMAAILDLRPVAVAMENVPPTVPVMQACALVLERHGYRAAVGVLSAETFGVAQTRKRAFLVANRTRPVALPEPTHQAYGDKVDEAQGSLFGEPLLPWVSMADALGWSEGWGWKRKPVALDRRCQQGPKDAREAVPAVEVERPAPSMTVSGLALGQFRWTTERQDAPGSISISEAARLQAFPNGYPWAGSRTSVFRQIGNACPPPVTAWVAGAALGLPREQIKAAVFAYLDDLYSVPLDRAEEGAA